MTVADLAAVLAVAAAVHPAFPEDAAVFAERLRLFPQGCFVHAGAAGVRAYCISHPWRYGDPPPLNTRLEVLPARPSTYYIHDIALQPALRGHGAASRVVARLTALARVQRLSTLSLVAINGSAGFWARHGFCVAGDERLAARLASYDAAATYMVRALD